MEKFKEKQMLYYKIAYEEIKAGKKFGHWIWFIFPQITGLGNSYYSTYYEIKSLNEAREYLSDEYLRNNLEEILKVLLKYEGKRDIIDIMGNSLDAQKLLSCMTLFKKISEIFFHREENIFSKVINAFFNGNEDIKTINKLKEMTNNNNSNYNNKKTNNYHTQNHVCLNNNFGSTGNYHYNCNMPIEIFYNINNQNYINSGNYINSSGKQRRNASCGKSDMRIYNHNWNGNKNSYN